MVTAALHGGAQDGKFHIKGVFEAMPDTLIMSITDIENGDNQKKLAECTSDFNSGFEMSGDISFPKMCSLDVYRYNSHWASHMRSFSIKMMVGPGDVINVSSIVPFDSLANSRQPELLVNVEGSHANEQYMEYLSHNAPLELEHKSAGYKGAEMYFASNANPDTVAKYDDIENALAAKLLDAQIDFAKKHPDYHISAYLLGKELLTQYKYDAPTLREFAQMISANPDTARVNFTNRELEWGLRYANKSIIPDFDVTTTDSEITRFSSLGKPGLKMIDFWASWCGPCRAAIPHVRELNEKYGDRLQIFAISCDEDESAWRKAMADENMTWTQLWLQSNQIGKIANAISLSSIPRLLLIDEAGQIVCSTNLPREITAAIENKLGK